MDARRVVYALLLCSAFASAGPGASNTGLGAQAPTPGRLVDIGGQRIHIHCDGQGSPTVVFENGAGDFASVWSLVQPRVTGFTRACSYDRGGYGASDPGALPRSYRQIALELRLALTAAGERAPFVLVGQSHGGLLVREFARRYPADVVGVVLVDAVHEDQRVNIGGRPQRIRDFARGRPPIESRVAVDANLVALRRAGARRAVEPLPLPAPLDRLSHSTQDVWRRAASDSVYRLTWNAEMDWSPEDLTRRYAERGIHRAPLGELPLVVIPRARAGDDSLSVERARLQADLATLSRRGEHVVATRAGHNVHLEEPQLVIDGIRRVIDRVRR